MHLSTTVLLVRYSNKKKNKKKNKYIYLKKKKTSLVDISKQSNFPEKSIIIKYTLTKIQLAWIQLYATQISF